VSGETAAPAFVDPFERLHHTAVRSGAVDALAAEIQRAVDALAEYLQAIFDETPFDSAETAPAEDTRIQNLSHREDSVLLAP